MKFNTIALHSGLSTEDNPPSRAVAVHRTSSYNFRDTKHASALFHLEELGFIYSRIQNPTQGVLEKRIADLEKSPAALALASGTSSIFYSIINLCTVGDEIVASKYLYGGTHTMFSSVLPSYGIQVKLVDPLNLNEVEAAINDKTRGIFIESIGNPSLIVPDFDALSGLAKKHEIPFIIDSTFTTPYLFNPIDVGADVTVHSLTKWIGGHGNAIGGIVVDSGKFNWNNPKFENFTQPDPSYHGLTFATDLGDLQAIAYILRMRVIPLRTLGAAISPDNVWMFLQGVETLGLRMERHSENALAVAQYLQKHNQVEWIHYPGLPSDPSYQNVKKYFKNGQGGGVLIFGIKGGKEAGEKFINNLKLFSHLANVGDAKSLAIHPASTTHSQLSEEEQKNAGIPPETVRLSVGIEDLQDILEDIEQALKAAK